MSLVPAFDQPPHARHGAQDELHVWFTEPPGAVVQLSKPQHFTSEQAEWLVGPAFEMLRKQFPSDEKLLLILDYREMTSRDPRARSLMVEKAHDIAHMFSHVIVVPPQQANPVYRTLLQASLALVSAFGTHIEISDSFDETIERNAVRVLRS